MTGWEDVALGDLGRVVTGRTPPAACPEAFGNDYPFVTPTDMDDRRYIDRTERRLSEAGATAMSRQRVPAGAVMVSCIGWQLGKAAIAARESFTNQQLNTIIPNKALVDPLFLYYHLTTRREEIKLLASGGTRTPILNKSRFEALRLRLPPRVLQAKIASMIGSIDDLIENNRRRVELLEEMAQTIYREWFIHFRYPGHESGTLVDSSLGRIPAGWRPGIIDEIVDLIKTTIDPSGVNPLTPAVGLEHIPRRHLTLDSWGSAADVSSRKGVFAKGDLLFGKIRPYFHKVSVAPLAGICSMDALVIRPFDEYWGQAVQAISSDDFVGNATQTANGTKMPRADWKVINTFPIAIPPRELSLHFTDIMRNSLGLAENLMFQSRKLTAARDLLLPQLVTGRIGLSLLHLDGLVENSVL